VASKAFLFLFLFLDRVIFWFSLLFQLFLFFSFYFSFFLFVLGFVLVILVFVFLIVLVRALVTGLFLTRLCFFVLLFVSVWNHDWIFFSIGLVFVWIFFPFFFSDF